MKNYSIDSVFGDLNRIYNFRELINESNYQDYLNTYLEVLSPDFVALFTTKSLEPIIFEKNYNLKFKNKKPETVQEIIDCGNKNNLEQSNKVLELDSEMFKFVFEYPQLIEPKKNLYTIIASNELIPDNSIALRRDIIVLSKDNEGFPHILFAAWFNVTELYGTNAELIANTKDFSDRKNENDSIRLALNDRLNSIIAPKISLTKREKEILYLISKGNTSEQIANNLNISKKTVDKHRQNIIKKNNTNNTSALLRRI